MESLEVQLLVGSVKLNTSTSIHRGLVHIHEENAMLALSTSSKVIALHRTLNLTRKCMQISTEGLLAPTITSYITKSFKYLIPLAIELLVTLKRIVMREKCSLKVRVSTRLLILAPMRLWIFLLAKLMWTLSKKPQGTHTHRSLKHWNHPHLFKKVFKKKVFPVLKKRR